MKLFHSVTVDQYGSAMIMFEPPRFGVSKRQVEIANGALVADIGSDGQVVGIEILDPRIVDQFFSPVIARLLKKYKINHK
jgi:uncharacterized protein YuzE